MCNKRSEGEQQDKPAQPTTFLTGEAAETARRKLLEDLKKDKLAKEEKEKQKTLEASMKRRKEFGVEPDTLQNITTDDSIGNNGIKKLDANFVSGSQKENIDVTPWVDVMRSLTDLQKVGAIDEDKAKVLRKLARGRDPSILITYESFHDQGLENLIVELDVLAQDHLHDSCACVASP